MQPKFLIAMVIVFIGALAAFNVMNTSKVNATISKMNNETTAQGSTDAVNSKQSTKRETSEDKIIDKPLSQQPKAIMDKAVGDFDKAQQLEQEKRDEIAALQ